MDVATRCASEVPEVHEIPEVPKKGTEHERGNVASGLELLKQATKKGFQEIMEKLGSMDRRVQSLEIYVNEQLNKAGGTGYETETCAEEHEVETGGTGGEKETETGREEQVEVAGSGDDEGEAEKAVTGGGDENETATGDENEPAEHNPEEMLPSPSVLVGKRVRESSRFVKTPYVRAKRGKK